MKPTGCFALAILVVSGTAFTAIQDGIGTTAYSGREARVCCLSRNRSIARFS